MANRIQIPFVVDTLEENPSSSGKFVSRPVVEATVVVNSRVTGASVSVYATENGTSTIPPTTDANGRINGWLPEGAYLIEVSGGKPTIATTTYAWDALSGRGIEDGRVGVESIWKASLRKDENKNDENSALEFLLPTGSIIDFGGASAPAGFLLCDGKAYSTAEYNRLFKVIGYTYGKPGAGEFNVPDTRGRTRIGAGSGPALTARTLGEKGGAETVALTVGQLAAHTHTQTSVGGTAAVAGSVSGTLSGSIANHQHGKEFGAAFITWDSTNQETAAPRYLSASSAGGTKVLWGNGGINTATGGMTAGASCTVSGTLGGSMTGTITTNSGTTGSTGSAEAHSNVQPFIVCTAIIKT